LDHYYAEVGRGDLWRNILDIVLLALGTWAVTCVSIASVSDTSAYHSRAMESTRVVLINIPQVFVNR
jgi:uncharacterized membrane protein